MDLSREELSKLENGVSDLIKSFGVVLIRGWQNFQKNPFEGERDPSTEFDMKIEKELRRELAKLLPNAGFIVEEGDNVKKGDLYWTIDPIDQTKNFVSYVPVFYTQVALVQEDVPILGVVFNPVSSQLFSASRGNGTRLNGNSISKKARGRLEEAVVDIDFGGRDQKTDWRMGVLSKLIETAYRVRITGGAFAPYLTTSGIDAFVILNEKTKIVDQMPRIILAREAGLSFDTLDVGGHKVHVAGSKSLSEEIREALSN